MEYPQNPLFITCTTALIDILYLRPENPISLSYTDLPSYHIPHQHHSSSPAKSSESKPFILLPLSISCHSESKAKDYKSQLPNQYLSNTSPARHKNPKHQKNDTRISMKNHWVYREQTPESKRTLTSLQLLPNFNSLPFPRIYFHTSSSSSNHPDSTTPNPIAKRKTKIKEKKKKEKRHYISRPLIPSPTPTRP